MENAIALKSSKEMFEGTYSCFFIRNRSKHRHTCIELTTGFLNFAQTVLNQKHTNRNFIYLSQGQKENIKQQ